MLRTPSIDPRPFSTNLSHSAMLLLTYGHTSCGRTQKRSVYEIRPRTTQASGLNGPHVHVLKQASSFSSDAAVLKPLTVYAFQVEDVEAQGSTNHWHSRHIRFSVSLLGAGSDTA